MRYLPMPLRSCLPPLVWVQELMVNGRSLACLCVHPDIDQAIISMEQYNWMVVLTIKNQHEQEIAYKQRIPEIIFVRCIAYRRSAFESSIPIWNFFSWKCQVMRTGFYGYACTTVFSILEVQETDQTSGAEKAVYWFDVWFYFLKCEESCSRSFHL